MNVNANVKYVEHKNNELMKEASCEGMLAQRQRLGPESSLLCMISQKVALMMLKPSSLLLAVNRSFISHLKV